MRNPLRRRVAPPKNLRRVGRQRLKRVQLLLARIFTTEYLHTRYEHVHLWEELAMRPSPMLQMLTSVQKPAS